MNIEKENWNNIKIKNEPFEASEYCEDKPKIFCENKRKFLPEDKPKSHCQDLMQDIDPILHTKETIKLGGYHYIREFEDYGDAQIKKETNDGETEEYGDTQFKKETDDGETEECEDTQIKETYVSQEEMNIENIYVKEEMNIGPIDVKEEIGSDIKEEKIRKRNASEEMMGKRSASSKGSGTEHKRQRKMITIVEKVKLLDLLKEGRSFAAVGRHYGLNESTVRYIKKDEKNIRATAAVSFNPTAKRVVTSRNKGIVRMEPALALWISDCRKKNIPLDTNIIREKARNLYTKFAEDPEAGPSTISFTKPTKFNASKGWFEKFKKRIKLKSVVLHGEAASADKAAVEEYESETFRTIIEEGDYKPEQVFNMDETGLWKRMPSRTFIMTEEVRAPGFNSHDFNGFSPDEIHHSAVNKTEKLAKLLGGEGFNDMTPDDVNELLEAHSDSLTDEDVTEIMKSASEEEEEHEGPGDEEEEGLSLERLATLVKMAKELQRRAEEWDPQMIRSLQFRNVIDGGIEVYKNLLVQKKRQLQQLPNTMYLTRKKNEDTHTKF